MDSTKVKSHHQLPNDHSQAGLAKKPKLHHHDGKPKKHKSDKHKSSKHDKSSVSVKKELPLPIKRKPMISESESEDDIPLNAHMISQAPLTRSESPLVTVKMEGKVELGSQMRRKESLLAVKNEKKLLGNDDIPLAQLKSKPSKAGVKRKSKANDSDRDDDEDFKVQLKSKPSKAVVKRKSKADDSDRDDDEDFKVQLKSKPSKAVVKRKSKADDSDRDDEDFEVQLKSKPSKAGVKRKSKADDSDMDDDEDFEPKKPKPTPPSKTKLTTPKSAPAKGRKTKAPPRGAAKAGSGASASPVKGGRKKKEEEREVWKWWEEEPHPEGVKWLSLEHKGPYFAPAYEPLPKEVKFRYSGKVMSLSTNAEEAAGFFAKMLDHEYTTKDVFCKNFFQDWRKEMTASEASTISNFSKCDFTEIHAYYKERSEERKAMSKDQKAAIKAENEGILAEYGWCMIDGHKEKIGNFKIEPPCLFRGRGDHPKQGKIKKRIEAKDVIINIGTDAVVPDPPPGHRWGKVQHNSKVTWLASWTENIQGSIKYVMLNPTSRLKGEKDWAKYEVARRLKTEVDVIRRNYESDFKAKEMKARQRAVAMYFIDKLALRAGNEKDSDETADTVGCCSLRVEHITLHDELDGKDRMVVFDFLGKDSIRYYNSVQVDKAVFKNLALFMQDKDPGDDLFDRLNTAVLNQHLSSLMDGLTAKVFRTYNASNTLQEQLIELTKARDVVPSKILSYNRANRAVAILCNHQRAPPKTFDKQMSNLQEKISAKEDAITEAKSEIKSLKKEVKATKDSKATKKLEAKKKQLVRLEEQLQKQEVQATDKQENKEIALGTSKLNYLDPRISVAWCKKYHVPLEKVYNKSQRDKFAWAIDMAGEDFEF